MRSKAFAVGLWLLGFAAAAALAQQPVAFHGNSWKSYPGTTDGAPFVLHSEVAEVGVQLAVTDRSGKPVTGLHPDDLQILDNGIPAVITELRREDELPLRVALVIDGSDSTTVAPGMVVTSHPGRLIEFATWGASSGPATTVPTIG